MRSNAKRYRSPWINLTGFDRFNLILGAGIIFIALALSLTGASVRSLAWFMQF